MRKRYKLIEWAKGRDWFYLREVPKEDFEMSLQSVNSALRDLCDKNQMQFRIVGLKQYKLIEPFDNRPLRKRRHDLAHQQ